MVALPEELAGIIAPMISGQGSFVKKTAQLSGHYRAGGVSNSAVDLTSYLITRMPATYAAIATVLAGLPSHFSPKTVLDVGSGPGTASWAAVEAISTLSHVTLLDNNQHFLNLAKMISSQSSRSALLEAKTALSDVQAAVIPFKADLVVCAYALIELPVTEIAGVTQSLWNACNEVLVLVEPGTPQGFSRILEARRALSSSDCHILAPCTHKNSCPLPANDWCHFKVRLPRTREHLHAKNANVPFEDEKFSYLVVTRKPEPHPLARILAPPVQTKPQITFKLCSESGLTYESVATRNKPEYRRVRKLQWGNAF